MNQKIFISLLVTAFGTGCTVHTKHIGGTYEPSLTTNYTGILSIELSEDISDVMPHMIRICSTYGGLRPGSAVRVDSPVGWKGMGNTYWKYQCNGLGNREPQRYNYTNTTLPPSTPTPISAPKKPLISVEEARQKCRDLGFKEGTDAFADCGLKLIK